MIAKNANGARRTEQAAVISALSRTLASFPPSIWSCLFCASLLVLLLRLWQADLRVPFVYGGDAALFVSMAKALLQGEWIWSNSHLAAPFGFELWDLPIFITLDAAGMKGLTLFTRSPGLVVNLAWLLGMILAAGCMTWCMKRLAIHSWIAVSIGVIYALQTFGFSAGINHLHSLFYLIPFIATGALELAAGRLSIHRPSEEAISRKSRPRKLLASVPRYLWLACIGIGLSYAYNAFFSCFLLLAAAALAFMTRRNWREFLWGAGTVLLICVVSIINLSPAIYYQAVSGKNLAMDFKVPVEEEMYGLEIHHLLIPIPDHPFVALRHIQQVSARAGFQSSRENTNSKLGITGSVGFLFLLVFLLRASLRGSVGRESGESPLGACAALMLSCLLLATIGGFGSFFNVFVAHDIRCYARIVPFIDYFCLTAVAVLLMRLENWWQRRSLSAGLFGAMLVAITIFAAADQAMVSRYIHYADRQAVFYDDAAFVRRIEGLMPRGASVFQLPYSSFPIDPGRIDGMAHYDHAKPYVHSTDLRWTWGAMPGRAAGEWVRQVAGLPIPAMVHKLVHAGFSGVWVDRFGYAAGASPEAELSSVLATAPVRSADGRFIFVDLRSFAARVLEEEATTSRSELFSRHPIEIIPDGGFYGEEHNQARRWRWAAKKAGLILRNELNIPRSVEVWATLETRGPGQIMITGAQANDAIVISGVRDYERKIALPAQGQVRLSFSCDCRRVDAPADPRSLYLRLVDFRIVDPSAASNAAEVTKFTLPRLAQLRSRESRPAGHGRSRRLGVD